MQTQNIYFISGLGADYRMFQQLALPEWYRVISLDWIAPRQNESIPAYASRLGQHIDTSQPFQLVGLSFGGMVAAEMAKVLKPLQTIIISSVPTGNDIPWYFKAAGLLRLPDLMPAAFLKTAAIHLANPFAYWFFGARTKVERSLLKQILRDTDTRFLKWALKAITVWESQDRPPNLVQIHGAADKVLPLRYTSPDYLLQKGAHLMVLSQAGPLSSLLTQVLDNHPKSR